MGIVQDSLLASAKMTKRDVFIPKTMLMNLLMWVDDWDGRIPIPAVMMPVKNKPGEYEPLWTGKQVFSLIIPDGINLRRTSNGHPKGERPQDMTPEDTLVQIEQGEILSGNIDKKTLGTSGGGLVHVVFNQKGPEAARILLNQVQQVTNYWILQHSFTVGIGDTVADTLTLEKVMDFLNAAKHKVESLVKDGQKGDLKTQPGRTMQESFEDYVNIALNGARDSAGKAAEKSLTVENAFKATVTAGSKGSFINISQIMACVGQQNVEGQRIPYGFQQRTLPHFTKDDLGPESRGFVENSYLKGLSPQEFYFHAMGGREGLIDTACKVCFGCVIYSLSITLICIHHLVVYPSFYHLVVYPSPCCISITLLVYPSHYIYHSIYHPSTYNYTIQPPTNPPPLSQTAETGYIQRRLVKALEDVMVRYDGTVRNGRDEIVQFLYGEDGMDGASVETQSFSILIKNSTQMEESYKWDPNAYGFGEFQGRPFMEPQVINNIIEDTDVQRILDMEFQQLERDQAVLQRVMYSREPGAARYSDTNLPLPVNMQRLILNAQKEFKVDVSKPSDMHPKDVVDAITDLTENKLIGGGRRRCVE